MFVLITSDIVNEIQPIQRNSNARERETVQVLMHIYHFNIKLIFTHNSIPYSTLIILQWSNFMVQSSGIYNIYPCAYAGATDAKMEIK